MPDPASQEPARPPSRPWLRPVAALCVLLLGAAALLLVRHRPGSFGGSTATPTPAASPDTTAKALPEVALTENKNFQPPKILTTRPVIYPEQALLNRLEGVVRVKFSIDETGRVSNAFVTRTSGSTMLDAMVLEYDLRKWTFQPATLFDKPIAGSLEKDFEFHLDPNEQRALAEDRLKAALGTPDAPYPREALALKAHGTCTITVSWTAAGLVDTISLAKSSGSNILDRTALRFAFTHWRIDPKDATGKDFTKAMTFTPPPGASDTPPPLAASPSETTPDAPPAGTP